MSSFIDKRASELGLKKRDARGSLVLEVDASDIKRATTKSPDSCAFSRACRRGHSGVKAAYFYRSTAWLEYEDKIVRYLLPPSMQKEIVAFDRNKTMEPGTYCLVKPAKSQLMSEVKKRSKKRPGRHMPGSGKIKRNVIHRTTGIRSVHGHE